MNARHEGIPLLAQNIGSCLVMPDNRSDAKDGNVTDCNGLGTGDWVNVHPTTSARAGY